MKELHKSLEVLYAEILDGRHELRKLMLLITPVTGGFYFFNYHVFFLSFNSNFLDGNFAGLCTSMLSKKESARSECVFLNRD